MTHRRLRPLSRLRAGQAARVAALEGGREFQARLVSMGLLIGTQITVVRASGDSHGAALIAVGPMRLGIGRGMAEKIMVTVEKRGAKGCAHGPNTDCGSRIADCQRAEPLAEGNQSEEGNV